MRIDQLALRFEDNRKWVRLWKTLPPDSRSKVARLVARLCIRAVKIAAPVADQKGRTDHAT